MAKKTVPDMKEIFRQAAEIAQQVPENMQEAAFNRALDLLVGTPETETTPSKPEKGRANKSARQRSKESDDSIDTLLNSINSTQHPGVTSAVSVLDRSLMILQIALQDHGVDGLTTSQISRVLTEKFRIGTTVNQISDKLGSATGLVDRVKVGKSFLYKIMEPGEAHLAHRGEGDSAEKAAPKRKAKAKPKKKTPKRKSERSSKPGQRESKSRPGPKEILESLIEEGYFNERREIGEIVQHIKDGKGYTFATTGISNPLVRLMRDGKLNRSTNAQGRYEYFAPAT